MGSRILQNLKKAGIGQPLMKFVRVKFQLSGTVIIRQMNDKREK